MRKIKKILICVTFIIVVGIAYFFNMEEVHAASGDVVDITPPRGIVKVEGATLKDEVYYIGSTNITLNIEVVDDYTKPENIKMILSSGEITGEIAINDDNWKTFEATKNWQIEAGKENLIYLYLKDEALIQEKEKICLVPKVLSMECYLMCQFKNQQMDLA